MRPLEWCLVGLVVVAFGPAVAGLAGVWLERDYYSHGFLVPVVSGFVAWLERDARSQLPSARDPRGAVLLGLGLVLYAAGLGFGVVSLQGLALVTSLAGSVWLLRGPVRLRALAFPIGFLLFAVPVPDAWLAPVIVQLQLFVSAGAGTILRAVGVEVVRDGNIIQLASGESLFVAEACSGVTSIVTLAPLGVLFARFSEREAWRRAVLVASVVPIAMLGNLLRVVLTTVAADRMGVAAATATALHESAGLAVYVGGCLALVGVGWLLGRVPRPAPAS
jgi:exosortase